VLSVDVFIDKSSANLQMYLWNLIERAGLRRVPETRAAVDKIITTVFSRFSVAGVPQQF